MELFFTFMYLLYYLWFTGANLFKHPVLSFKLWFETFKGVKLCPFHEVVDLPTQMPPNQSRALSTMSLSCMGLDISATVKPYFLI